MTGERHMSLVATLQRLLAVVDRCPDPVDETLSEEWHRARAEAHMVLRVEGLAIDPVDESKKPAAKAAKE